MNGELKGTFRVTITTALLFFLLTTLAACLNAQSDFRVLNRATPTSPSAPQTIPPLNFTPPTTCIPTFDDGVSPSYKPDAPIRSTVGKGHILTGVVLSSIDCMSIQYAKIELWPEYPDLGHPDEFRSTIYTDAEGKYRFECNLPEHIHMRISAPGFVTIGQNSYHPNGKTEGTFDIVLRQAP